MWKGGMETKLIWLITVHKEPAGRWAWSLPLIFKSHLEVLSFQVPTWRNIKAVRFSEVLSSSHLEIRLLYHLCIWAPQKITRRFQKWIPLCLADPNDPTSQSVQVLLLGSVTAAPQSELGDRGGLDPQPLVAYQLEPRSEVQQPCTSKGTIYVS